MTAITMNYVVNPFSRMLNGLYKVAQIAGYARATAELRRLGYYAEANECAKQLQALKASK